MLDAVVANLSHDLHEGHIIPGVKTPLDDLGELRKRLRANIVSTLDVKERTPDEFEAILVKYITEVESCRGDADKRNDAIARGYHELLEFVSTTDFNDPRYLCWCAMYLNQVR